MCRKVFQLLFPCLSAVLLVSCSTGRVERKSSKMHYTVKRASNTVELGGGWNAGEWENANVLELKHHMGDKPEHFPRTRAKLLYDAENLYVFFKVEDRYVRAVAEKTHDDVCHDSCVEFFFASGEADPEDGYFNLEANCGGTILFHHGRQPLDLSDCKLVEVYSSMPGITDPEIAESTTWTLGYKLPFGLIAKHSGAEKPRAGVKWKANFYKCADWTSHPHWLTWSPIDRPTPNFHLPNYFGSLVFE